jgi:hypothetical protein
VISKNRENESNIDCERGGGDKQGQVEDVVIGGLFWKMSLVSKHKFRVYLGEGDGKSISHKWWWWW